MSIPPISTGSMLHPTTDYEFSYARKRIIEARQEAYHDSYLIEQKIIRNRAPIYFLQSAGFTTAKTIVTLIKAPLFLLRGIGAVIFIGYHAIREGGQWIRGEEVEKEILPFLRDHIISPIAQTVIAVPQGILDIGLSFIGMITQYFAYDAGIYITLLPRRLDVYVDSLQLDKDTQGERRLIERRINQDYTPASVDAFEEDIALRKWLNFWQEPIPAELEEPLVADADDWVKNGEEIDPLRRTDELVKESDRWAQDGEKIDPSEYSRLHVQETTVLLSEFDPVKGIQMASYVTVERKEGEA